MSRDAAGLIRFLTLGLCAVTFASAEEPAVTLLAKKCVACHNDKTSSSGLALTTRASVLGGGARGPAIKPGNPQDSLIVSALRQTGKLKMPPTGKLPDAEIEIIEKWIAADAPGLAGTVSAAPKSNHW